jgi:hypothetical protein
VLYSDIRNSAFHTILVYEEAAACIHPVFFLLIQSAYAQRLSRQKIIGTKEYKVLNVVPDQSGQEQHSVLNSRLIN